MINNNNQIKKYTKKDIKFLFDQEKLAKFKETLEKLEVEEILAHYFPQTEKLEYIDDKIKFLHKINRNLYEPQNVKQEIAIPYLKRKFRQRFLKPEPELNKFHQLYENKKIICQLATTIKKEPIPKITADDIEIYYSQENYHSQENTKNQNTTINAIIDYLNYKLPELLDLPSDKIYEKKYNEFIDSYLKIIITAPNFILLHKNITSKIHHIKKHKYFKNEQNEYYLLEITNTKHIIIYQITGHLVHHALNFHENFDFTYHAIINSYSTIQLEKHEIEILKSILTSPINNILLNHHQTLPTLFKKLSEHNTSIPWHFYLNLSPFYHFSKKYPQYKILNLLLYPINNTTENNIEEIDHIPPKFNSHNYSKLPLNEMLEIITPDFSKNINETYIQTPAIITPKKFTLFKPILIKQDTYKIKPNNLTPFIVLPI